MIMIKQLNILRDQAQHETCPEVDVAGQVMSVLCANQSDSVILMQKPLAWCAAIASTVAVSVAVIAMIQYFTADYPLMEVANTIAWVAQ